MDYIGAAMEDDILINEKQIVIFGCGKTGKDVYEVLKQRGLGDKIIGFCDNDGNCIGSCYDGKEIKTVSGMIYQAPQAAYLIAGVCVRDMVMQLQGQGITKIHIVRI